MTGVGKLSNRTFGPDFVDRPESTTQDPGSLFLVQYPQCVVSPKIPNLGSLYLVRP